jgi:hypothetical protein
MKLPIPRRVPLPLLVTSIGLKMLETCPVCSDRFRICARHYCDLGENLESCTAISGFDIG